MRILSIATTIIIMVPSYQIGMVLQGPIVNGFEYVLYLFTWILVTHKNALMSNLDYWMSIACASSYNILIK